MICTSRDNFCICCSAAIFPSSRRASVRLFLRSREWKPEHRHEGFDRVFDQFPLSQQYNLGTTSMRPCVLECQDVQLKGPSSARACDEEGIAPYSRGHHDSSVPVDLHCWGF
jgi:hypothetical protein